MFSFIFTKAMIRSIRLVICHRDSFTIFRMSWTNCKDDLKKSEPPTLNEIKIKFVPTSWQHWSCYCKNGIYNHMFSPKIPSQIVLWGFVRNLYSHLQRTLIKLLCVWRSKHHHQIIFDIASFLKLCFLFEITTKKKAMVVTSQNLSSNFVIYTRRPQSLQFQRM